jgi:cyclopropane fatty-acyl-phospholipid synthase-like methyltransferase
VVQDGHRVLDISIGSWGGVGCYLAERHPGVSVVSVLSSMQEHVHARQLAQELGVLDQMEFILADDSIKVLSIQRFTIL